MDVSRMLSNDSQDTPRASDRARQAHQYPNRHTGVTQAQEGHITPYGSSALPRPLRSSFGAVTGTGYPRASPSKYRGNQKHVVFQLIDQQDPRIQARLPMRVMISQHDTTDSIITTVKNFYGLYEYDVIFENKDGISIIAAYDNFDDDMIVYVRTIAQPPAAAPEQTRDSISPKKPSLGAPFEMRPPPQHTSAYSLPRTAARSAGVRSVSPPSELGQRSASAAPGAKPRIQRTKSKDNSVAGDVDGYSSGDNGGGSVASSRRSKTEQVNAEISVDNIVAGGRRKRAFESSQLPLFVPPQVPMSASISSISPQRRTGPPHTASPYAYPNQQTFAYPQPLPSPQSYGSSVKYPQSGAVSSAYGSAFQQPNRQLRGRPAGGMYAPARVSNGVLPTPDPTVGSVISDEDVALQLMRLGDPTAFSHGRTSTSTVDDALSGKAEAASSDEEDSEDDQDDSMLAQVPQQKKRRMNELPSDGTSGEEYEDRKDGTFETVDGQRRMSKPKSAKPRHSLSNAGKPRSHSMSKPKSKSMGPPRIPMSPSSMPASSRKGSVASTINFQNQLGADEEDLSTKPRCQRCRKSKKGCDRQRPCGRCKDAGIGAEGCVSEDEGNGRKGRYGRHMGVSVKKEGDVYDEDDDDASPVQASAPANGYFLAPALPDKSKKRKR